jgi:hypothetical protein
MTIAVFKPGGTIWGALEQKVIDMAELPAHVAEGWFDSAKDALDASDLAKMEMDNAAAAAMIADEQVRLDGRTKAARDLKAKLNPEPVPNVPADSTESVTASTDIPAATSDVSAAPQ